MSFDKEEFTQRLNARRAPMVIDQSPAALESADPAAVEQKASATWRADAAIRQEFLTESTYIAYCKAIASGSVRVSRGAGVSRHTRTPNLSGS